MYVSCMDVIKLPALKRAELIAGNQGLNRLVSWVHVVELPNVGDWVNSGELIFLTGIGLKNHKEDLVNILKDMDKKNAAGLFVEVGPYIEKIPTEVIEVANDLSMPVFEIPFEVKIIDVTQSICKLIFNSMTKERSMKELMEDILYGEISTNSEDILERAQFYGYEPSNVYKSIVVDIDNFASHIENEKIKDEKAIIAIKNEIENIIKDVCSSYNKKILYTNKSDSFIVMIPLSNHDTKNQEIRKISDNIRTKIVNSNKGITVNVGIGDQCKDLKEFKRSVSEAKKALKIIKSCNRVNTTREYKELGVFRLLFKIEDKAELISIYSEILGGLMEHDEKNGTDFLNTLEAYLREERNLGRTADVLFIHRNTMKYRLGRIQEILHCDLEDWNTCFNLNLAYKIKRYISMC